VNKAVKIGILGQGGDPDDPNVSKAGYRQITGLARLLSEGNDVTFYPLHRRKLNIKLPGCQVMPIHSTNLLIRWLKLAWRIMAQRRKLDLLIVHNPTLAAFPVVPLGKLLSLPVVVVYMDRQTGPIYIPHKILRFLSFFSERLFLLTMRNWLSISTDLADRIRKFRKRANIMLYQVMVSLPPFPGEEAKPLSVKVDPDKINIAYSGALHYGHGVDILLDAFSQLKTSNRHLYITGFGPMKSALEDRVKGKNLANVTITFLDDKVIDDFLTKMDILVIPYRNTEVMRMVGFPSKILSYLWAGKAIIATSVFELPKLIQHEKTGILIPSDSEEALREALTDLITNERKRRELGLNARKYFEENFSPEAVKPRINDFLLNIANPGLDSVGVGVYPPERSGG
jgi:glycosyltransferase involved in cell wall biosynthesis